MADRGLAIARYWSPFNRIRFHPTDFPPRKSRNSGQGQQGQSAQAQQRGTEEPTSLTFSTKQPDACLRLHARKLAPF